MGVIKEGKISGKLPTNVAFAVHYPAYPSSMERAIETLGGTQAIAKARGSQSNKLELHFRPEDPYSHPAFGVLQGCNNFLLKITKSKVKNVQDAAPACSSLDTIATEQQDVCPESRDISQPVTKPQNEFIPASRQAENQVLDEKECLSADIVACIPEAYSFNGMADYQYVLAVHADVARQKKRNWAEFEKGGLMDVDQDDLMILLPPLFSMKDTPESIALKPSKSNILKRNHDKVIKHRWEMEIEPSLALDFNIKEIPKKVNWEKHIPKDSEQWEWQKAVCGLFDERPIWVKDSLWEHLKDRGLEIGYNMMRRLLFRAAYYFSNGPFLRFWIRKGYDPRTDPESRIYQRTDFRIPEPLRNSHEASGSRWDDICAFRAFPNKCQTSFPLCELEDDYIQEEIRKPPQSTCNCVTGWFPSIVLDTLRLRVAVRFLSIYPSVGAKPFLKSKSSRFEKFKRMCLFPEEVKQKGQPVGKELEENQDKEPDEEVEEEEEYEEDENEDNYEEELNLAGQDEDLSTEQQHSDSLVFPIRNIDPGKDDHETNISRNYLQDLFGSYPFNGGSEHELMAANDSDGEYQIYEDYNSDGNSDEDDEY